ncbi:MAG: ATP-binding protein [Bacteroidales bacterium]|nr:ATP-binding protein [Bacteroidales bacterium]
MLINFTVGNFRSIKEKQTLSMEASSITEFKERVITNGKYKILPSAAIYGANSSGKSNLIKAIEKFKNLIVNSNKLNSTDLLDIEPFLLNTKTEKEPSYFEIELFIDNDIYRYGFSADSKKIYEEWLYERKEGKGVERCLFIRTKNGIGVEKYFKEGEGLEEKTRDNALFLSVVDNNNGEIAKKVFFEINNLIIVSGIEHDIFSNLTNIMCDNSSKVKAGINSLLNTFDLGFHEFKIPRNKELAKVIKAYTIHNKYDDNGNIVGKTQLNMLKNESSGTNKLFDLITFIYVTLRVGFTLVIDELDAKLHPILTRRLITLFNDPKSNSGNAQLIFATHDSNLLSNKIFRRDQIWFTEKDDVEATDLYSLVEFKEPDGAKVRKDNSFEKDYINGRYGAIPYIKN